MALRLIETMLACKRPKGMTARQAIEDFQKRDPDLCNSFMRGTQALLEYFVEQSKKYHLTN